MRGELSGSAVICRDMQNLDGLINEIMIYINMG